VVIPDGEHFKPGDWDPHSYGELEGLFIKDSWAATFGEDITPEENDIVLNNRTSFDAFAGTDFHELLEKHNVGALFVGGFLTNVCIEETIRTASEIDGLDVYALTDGCAAKTEQEHFAATTGTLPLFSTPVTCNQAKSIIFEMKEKGLKFVGATTPAPTSSNARASLKRMNENGDRRHTYLQEARHSAYLKYDYTKMDPKLRLSISTLLHYYPEKEEPDDSGFDPVAPIFFMVGSQRSGSNWLRTMLSEREDLAGPHPPHILRDFFPILDKFGDLEDEENLEILVDHVCTFVESNQVQWLDKHGRPMKFDRQKILDIAVSTVHILRVVYKDKDINQKYYLIAIFDEIMNINAIALDKQTWICKSMGNSKYHDMFLLFYGEERLRYIYLVRDPRDVSLSFMKTPVGDCHYYSIIKKWTNLQGHALHVLSVSEDLVHQVRYENLLQSNEETMKGVNDFMGKRKFGKVLRRGSVAILKNVEDMMKSATSGTNAKQAAVLSYQFQNLTRGASFRKEQFQKWRKQLADDDIHLIESVAHEVMSRLGYNPHVVWEAAEALEFSDKQIAEFLRLNEEGIKKMHDDLAVENPEDLARRLKQKAVLEQDAVLLSSGIDEESDDDVEDDDDDEEDKLKSMYPYCWPKGAGKFGYLSTEDVADRFEIQNGKQIYVGGFEITYSVAIERGYYPSALEKPCQDSYLVGGFDSAHWLCVFDGHGPTGHECAQYARDNVVKNYNALSPSKDALGATLLKTNEDLHESVVDDSNSGTTALCVLIEGEKILVGNVGDCRCVIISKSEDGKLYAKALTSDQTPHRKDELERIKKAGGLVMSSEQYDHEEPMHENWVNGDSPPRVWSRVGKFPGCAFTRSIGDRIAKDLGVTAHAEFTKHILQENDEMIIIGSDGIFEFISDSEVATISSNYETPSEICRALVGESYKRWIKREERTDDITIIVGFISRVK